MLVKVRRKSDLPESAVTPESVYVRRREVLAAMGFGVLASAVPLRVGAKPMDQLQALEVERKSRFSTDIEPNSYEDITSYNNFYEYGYGKDEPAVLAPKLLKTEPWSVTVDGEAEVTGTFALEDIMKPYPLEERIYRFRCVEAWSMVVPWVGFPLAKLIERFRPTSKAKYVEFVTLHDPEQMPNQKRSGLDWPYNEGLRMDEAMNPLTLMVVGLYGKELPAQNGAPLRLIVPWKYGFKSIKSIVAIRFREDQPTSTWMKSAGHEYGFYANVNPKVDHPRWSQAKERRIGGSLFGAYRKHPTLMFNGYEEEVAQLYAGMDLRKNY